ncbi:MAG: tRNA (guanine(6)-N2)-methyltransferase, partial [Desulfobacteraceae bacterium]
MQCGMAMGDVAGNLEELDLRATTTPGLEDVAVEEIGEITGQRAWIQGRGRVEFKGRQREIFLLNYLSRSIHRVFLVMAEFTLDRLEDVYDAIRELGPQRLIDLRQSFAVRAERHGTHPFRSMDVERAAGQAVVDSFMDRIGSRPSVNLEEPDVTIWVEVRDRCCKVGVDTTGRRSLHRRGYRVAEHPAPLKPSLAYSLVRLSGWSQGELLIDPMCGSGTICIEAALWACGAPHRLREDLAVFRLTFLDQERFREMKAEIDYSADSKAYRIFGADIRRSHIASASENARAAGVHPCFCQGDATRMDLGGDRIVTNPPYGLRMGSRRRVKRLYEGFVENLYRHSWKRV